MLLGDIDTPTANDLRDHSIPPYDDSLGAASAAFYCTCLAACCLALAPFIGWLLAGIRYP